ncbi:GH3 auxin-responsive promoter [Cyclonatronum proteinivorum]|uniref:GH3 auxin-responsive promoter n=1 Tax=Cyclonatronum proteinivorum TaxID=1457365 RepID=A0A345UNT3_9BACT|nr:GH3 auxin-responsive promoter family protein [Cyclonatronum proteinivorum]AXJ02135.1 GH3 auxin-responsive promoter [Cyclonatronum proteinivorum]
MKSIIQAQNNILEKYLQFAADTAFGKKYGFKNLKSYHEFRKTVHITSFKDYDTYREAIKRGEPDLTWPGTSGKFAISAGTTGAPKDIPIFPERERSDKIFLRRVALSYLRKNPNIFKIWGKQMSLPGTIERDPDYPGVLFGEISGHLALMAPPVLSRIQILEPQQSVWMTFKDKLEIAVERGVKHDLRVLTSLPSVMLRYFQMVLDYTGKDHIGDVWPNFRLLVSGGEPLPSYKNHLQKLCEGMPLHFIENYGASEGYFAFNTHQDRTDMKLVVDNNVFYEFIPNPSQNRDELYLQETIPIWEVEAGKPYAMVVTTNSGLWRYLLNDLVIFTDLSQPRIRVAGRASDVLDNYGETIEAIHVQECLERVTAKTGGIFSSCTVGVVHEDAKKSPHHVWFIRFAERPQDLQAFAKAVDEDLARTNRSYNIRRNGDAIGMPEFYALTQEAITSWQNEHTKVKAQTKFPRMIHDSEKCLSLMKRCEKLA